MKLQCTVERSQPDPFIFQDGDTFYLYVTAKNGVEAYSAKDIFGQWQWEGEIAKIEGANGYWAPCIIKIDQTYYLYTDMGEMNVFPSSIFRLLFYSCDYFIVYWL